MLDLLIKNCVAVTMDEQEPVISGACIGVRAGKIAFVTAAAVDEPAQRVVDAAGKIAMPGLVNTHSHAAMALMRGYADDHVLQTWLYDYVFPVEARMTEEDIYLGMQLAMAEMLASGTVSVTDMYMYLPAMARSVADAGLYGNLSNAATCFDPAAYRYDTDRVTQQNREVLRAYHDFDDGRIRLDAAIHAEYTSFPRVWRDFAAFAAENGLNMHVHLSETHKEHEECVAKYGKTPAAVLAENGVFDVRATAAHCVWVTDADLDILRAKNVTVAHNPVSNLKLGSGIAPVGKMMEKGVRVSLGTDGVCSNNNHDLFEEIKLSALLQKGLSGDPRQIPAHRALDMATRAGAYAQGREDSLGCLKPGYDASLILVDTCRPGLMPVHHPESTLAYSARGGDVCLTMVRGRVLYENGVFTTIDMERIRAALPAVMDRLFRS
ncbi:MAG: amidohydrolase [Clostridia bacterium]|nr:amidohydrolase [Clostridia bacterium]